MVGPSVGIDDEIGLQVAPRGLYEDVDPTRFPRATLCLTDDPAHRVAGRHWPLTGKGFARLEGDVGDVSRRAVDLEEGADFIGIDLGGVQIVFA
ncbi:hypothetical protein D3C86_1214770 [compost metagenome]